VNSTPHLVILADDLTGGLDTGVAFAARGWRTVLRFAGARREARGASGAGSCQPQVVTPGDNDPAETPVGSSAWRLAPRACIVWDTETRHADEESAARAVREVCEHPSVRAAPRVYKKIDSTLRGPWLRELREVWKARVPLTTLLCPAFPAVGRTVVDGEVRIHGRPLAAAGFTAAGPLRELLLQRWCGRVVSLPTGAPEAPLFDPDREPWLLLADAATDADLEALVTRLRALDLDRLLCGAGGLAAAWARVLIPEPQPLPPLAPISGPVWVIAGSQHAATRAQMQALAATPGTRVAWIEANVAGAAARLRDLPECVTHGFAITVPVRAGETDPDPNAIDRAWAADLIAALAALAQERGVAAFAATGGETAALLLQAMEAPALEIDRELLPGIPLCRLADGPWAGTPLITKAGGFGEVNALVRSVALIRTGGASVRA
jgi:uncharacterized protein YgbK (DUF1537 family)